MSQSAGAPAQAQAIRLELSYEQVTTVLASINVAIMSIDEGKWPQVLKELYQEIAKQRKGQMPKEQVDDAADD